MDNDKKSRSGSAMLRIGTVVVKLRWLLIAIFIALCVLCVVSPGNVDICSDISSLMPEDSESCVGAGIVESEFKSFDGCRIVLEDTDVESTELICEKLRSVAHVAQVIFSGDTDYVGGSALVSVYFDPGLQNDSSRGVINSIKRELSGCSFDIASDIDTGKSTAGGMEQARTLAIFAVAVLLVLALVTLSFGELPVLILTLLVSVVLSLGSDRFLGSISYVSRTLSVFVQLSLSAACALLMCARFRTERASADSKTAAAAAFAASVPTVLLCGFASAGILLILSFMSFGLGADLSYVLMKAVGCSVLTLILFTPSLLAVLGNAIDVSVHKSFLPKLHNDKRFSKPVRALIPVLLVMLIAVGLFVMQNRDCTYGLTRTESAPESRELRDLIDSRFGGRQNLTVLIPAGDYDTEIALAEALSECDDVVNVIGLNSAKLSNGLSLLEPVSMESIDGLITLDPAVKQAVFALYAAENGDYRQLDDIGGYSIPLIRMVEFLYEKCSDPDSGLSLGEEQVAVVNALGKELSSAKAVFDGKDYSRITVCLRLPSQSEAIRLSVDATKQTVAQFYPDHTYIVGDFMTDYELYNISENDSMLIPLASAAVVFVFLLLSLSALVPSLLISLVVSGSVWIGIAIHAAGGNAGSVCCIIAGSILLCVSVCSALGLSSAYHSARKNGSDRTAAASAATEQCFPAVFGAGLIALAAGLSLGLLTSDPVIAETGMGIAVGAPVCTVFLMLALPRLLIVSDFEAVADAPAVTEKPAAQSSSPLLRRLIGVALALISVAMLIFVPYTKNGIISSADSTAKLCAEQLSDISVLDQINVKLNMAQEQYEGTKLLFAESYVTDHYVKDQLEEGEDQYYTSKKQLENGEYLYSKSKAQYEQGRAAYEQALIQYNTALAEYESGLAEFNTAQDQYNAAQAELDKLMGIYNTVMPLYNTYQWNEQQYQDAVESGNSFAAAALYPLVTAGRVAFQTALGEYGSLTDLINYVEAAKAELSTAKAQLDSANEVLTASKNSLDTFKKSLEETSAQLQAAESQLNSTRYQLDSGRANLSKVDQQLAAGQQKIQENQELLKGSLANLDQYADEKEKLIQGTELILEVSAIREQVGKDATYGDIFSTARSYYNDLLFSSQRQSQFAKLAGAVFTAAAALAIAAALLLLFGAKGILPFIPSALTALGCAAGFTLCKMFCDGYETILLCAAVLCLASVFAAAIAIKSRPAAVSEAADVPAETLETEIAEAPGLSAPDTVGEAQSEAPETADAEPLPEAPAAELSETEN